VKTLARLNRLYDRTPEPWRAMLFVVLTVPALVVLATTGNPWAGIYVILLTLGRMVGYHHQDREEP